MLPHPPSPRRTRSILAAALVAALAGPLGADDGDADPAFSTDGQTTYAVSTPAVAGERASAVAALADASLLIGGYSWGGPDLGDFAVVRYGAAGAPDLEFGMLGSSVVDLGADDYLQRIFVETDGGILLAGFSAARPALARLDADGELDETFGDAGSVVLDPPWPSAELVGVDAAERRSASGRTFFYGRCRLCPANDALRPFVVAATAAGAADATFDGDGWTVLPMDLGAVSRLGLDLDAAGRPLIAIESGAPVALWRLTTGGAPDPAWGGDGRVDTEVTTGNPFQLLVDPARDRLYVYGAYALHALRSDGTLDPAFGDEGVAFLGAWDEDSFVRHFALQGDGKLVGVGGIDPNGSGLSDVFLIRLGVDGEPDASFHGNGVRRVPFDLAAGAVDVGAAVTLSGGRPVAVGYATEGDGDERWAILRTLNALVFADGFERGTIAGWAGY